MTEPAVEMTTAPKTFTCAKCDGRGRLNWTRVANGVCFVCKGTGKLANRDVTNDRWYRMQISDLCYTAEIAMSGISCGNVDYAEHYLRAMLPKMRKVGTEGAREVLKHIRKGEYSRNDGETHRIDNDQATQLITRLIEMGREAQAAEAA